VNKVLVIDNYDSFTYNLVQLLGQIGCERIEVVRNDRFEMNLVDEFNKVLLSPGPGIPSEAGLMPELVRKYAATKSILGICLGHQCIGEIFGATLFNLPKVLHGKGVETIVTDPEETLFAGLPPRFNCGRYHSWVLQKDSLPECLKVTATDPDGEVMALSHNSFDVKGLQFHPESILTQTGPVIIKNWLSGDLT